MLIGLFSICGVGIIGAFFYFCFQISLLAFVPLICASLVDWIIYALIIRNIITKGTVCKIISGILIAAMTVFTLFFACLSAKMFYDFWTARPETHYEKKLKERSENEANGIISFNIDIPVAMKPNPNGRKASDRTVELRMTMNKGGNFTLYNPNNSKSADYAFIMTDLIYYKDGSEPCGFMLTIERKSDGAKNTWRLHRKKSYFHENEDKIRYASSSDFEQVKSVIQAARNNSHNVENPLCVDILK